jgi:hypothetical protein
MTEGPRQRFRFGLGRLFLWISVVGVWLAVLVDAKYDAVHGRPWFAEVLAVSVGILLAVGQLMERRVCTVLEANKIEWTLLWVGTGMVVAPVAYRIILN